MFERVINNLSEYSKLSKDAVELQYLVVPGMNTGVADINGFCNIADNLGVRRVNVTRDRNKLGNIDDNSAYSIALLLNTLKNKGVQARLFSDAVLSFTDEELSRINSAAAKLTEERLV